MSLLIIEYRFFKHQSQKLIKLKMRYKEYVESFKRSLIEYSFRLYELERNQDTTFIQYNYDDTCFLVVNREHAYLKEQALLFAKMHNLEQTIAHMYDLHEFGEPTRWISSSGPTIRKKSFIKKKVIQDFSLFWPLKRSQFWISSHFGPRKKENGSWGFHYGLDMAALKGTPVKAGASGEVIETSNVSAGYGKCIVIKHNNKYKTRYAHLDTIHVKVGDKVTAGQCIGRVGDTGNVRGENASHLHLEVVAFNKHINPEYVLL